MGLEGNNTRAYHGTAFHMCQRVLNDTVPCFPLRHHIGWNAAEYYTSEVPIYTPNSFYKPTRELGILNNSFERILFILTEILG